MDIRAADDMRFVSLITPPTGLDAAAACGVMAPFLGTVVDVGPNRFGVPPCIVASTLDAHAAEAAVRAICSMGGDAFAPSLADIAALGATMKIKHLELPGDGTLRAEFWRSERVTFDAASVQVLVRASLGKRPAGLGNAEAEPIVDVARAGLVLADIMLDTPGVWCPTAVDSTPAPPLRPTAIISEKLDIHLSSGQVLQIDGDKFGFRVLGSLRGHSDKANIDAMIELLRHLSDKAVLDSFFGNFKPPPGINRLRLPDTRLNNDHPAFAFYSRWVALMYRHVMEAA